MIAWFLYAVTLAMDPVWVDNFQATAEVAHSMSLDELRDPDLYFSPDCTR